MDSKFEDNGGEVWLPGVPSGGLDPSIRRKNPMRKLGGPVSRREKASFRISGTVSDDGSNARSCRSSTFCGGLLTTIFHVSAGHRLMFTILVVISGHVYPFG